MDSNSNKQSMHRYGFIYDLLLTKLYAEKGAPLNLLEIGVSEYEDGSLYAWGNADIINRAVGIDIKPYPGTLKKKTIFYELDAYNRETVDYLREIEGSKFDVIIHDGLAKKENQSFFLENYGDLLSENGLLICEDIFDFDLVNSYAKDDSVFLIDGWGNRGIEVASERHKDFYWHEERILIKSNDEKLRDAKVHESKPHIAKLPVKQMSDYERTSTALAISIPLFHSELDTQYQNFDVERFRGIHCKGAIWAGMSLLKNSDLGDNGVPLYFHIEDKIFDDALPVFKEFGIPESWCRKITAPVSETEPELKVNKTQFGKTYLGLLDDEIDTDILMLLDSDFFTCPADEKFEFYKILTDPILKRQPAMTYFNMRDVPYYWYVGMCLLASGLPDKMVYKEKLQDLEQRAYQRLGFEKAVDPELSAQDMVRRYYTENYMMTFPRGHETRDFAIENIATCHTAPYLFGMWSEYNYPFLELAPMLKVPVYDWESEYIAAKRGQSCFAHIRVDKCKHRSLTRPSKMHEYYDRFYEDVSRHVL